jgi:hypothetical protein
VNHLLRDRVAVKRPAFARSATGEVSSGAWPAGWTTIASNLPAGIRPLSGSYRQREYGRAKETTHRGYFILKSDVRVGDRIVVGASVYEVTFVASRCHHHLEVDLASVVAP